MEEIDFTQKHKEVLEIIDGMPLKIAVQFLNGVIESAQSLAIISLSVSDKTE